MTKIQATKDEATARPATEQGFMLLGLIVAIAIILIALSVAASKAAFTLRRDREAESVRRANQYVLAIRRYYAKFKHYPSSIEQLEGTNNIRYLRQQYVDPLTGKADYRLIPVGQNKTTVMGFFGEPLGGVASTGLGSAAGMQTSNSSSSTSTTSTSSSSTSSNSSSSQMGSGLSGSSGPIMGVGSKNSSARSIAARESRSTTTRAWSGLPPFDSGPVMMPTWSPC